MKDEDTNSPFKPKFSATIKAVLRGNERGIFALGVLFLLLAIAGLTAYTVRPTLWSTFFMIGGLAGLVALLVFYLSRSSETGSLQDGIPVEVSSKDLAVKTLVYTPRQAIFILRQVIQNRQVIPPPKGKVLGNPKEAQNLVEYSEDERDRIGQEIKESVQRQEEEALDRIKKYTESKFTPIPSEQTPEPPIQQISIDQAKAPAFDAKVLNQTQMRQS